MPATLHDTLTMAITAAGAPDRAATTVVGGAVLLGEHHEATLTTHELRHWLAGQEAT